MKPSVPEAPSSFETTEQLWELLHEALDAPQEGVDLASEEWLRLREELLKPQYPQKVAS